MNDLDSYILSCYRDIAWISPEHNVGLVQHTKSGSIYVKKVLSVYNPDVYRYLQAHHIAGTPEIVEVIEDGERLIVIEEFINGQLLRTILDNGNLFPEEEAVTLIEKLCVIIKALHSADPPIIHRDIKPSNIIITPDGSIRLLDMNASRQLREKKTEDTSLIGTVGYAAPEQYGFGASNMQTDIYSVGVVLCELVTGALPKDKIPEGRLGRIIRKCTQIDPKNRFKNVQSLMDALAACHKNTEDPAGQRNTYALPGFRTGKPTNMLIAAGAYISLLWLSLTYKADGIPAGAVTYALRGIYLCAGFLILLFTGNYRNIWAALGLQRIHNVWLRAVIIFIIDFVLIILMLMIMILTAALMGVKGVRSI